MTKKKKKISPAMRKLLKKRAKQGDARASRLLGPGRPAPPVPSRSAWWAESDPTRSHDLLSRVTKAAKAGDSKARDLLWEYVQAGPLESVRRSTAAMLGGAEILLTGLDASWIHPELSSASEWLRVALASLLIEVEGAQAWPTVGELAVAEGTSPLAACRLLSLLRHASGRAFAETYREDWTKEEVPVSAVRDWLSKGCPPATVLPNPRLQAPASSLEKAIAKLDQKLANLPPNSYATTHSFLPAPREAIKSLQERWTLPETYLEFLSDFSPRAVVVPTSAHSNLTLYGADDLVEGQGGYAVNSVTGAALSDWPRGLLVIATEEANPICLDLTGLPESVPVVGGFADEGPENFGEVSRDFLTFLRLLARKKTPRLI